MTTVRSSEAPEGTHGEIPPKIRARLAEISSPGYTDPARKNLTTWDWVAFIGFLAACVAGFVAWGY